MEEQKKIVGLTDAEVLSSREKHGSNILTPKEKESLLKQFFEKFTDPLIVILIIAGLLSIIIAFYEYFALGTSAQTFFEPAGIFIAILLATGIAFYFEKKANEEFSLLNKVNDEEPVQVIRNGMKQAITKKDVVVGDIVILNTGCEIPADGILLEATSLSVDESSLTGELTCPKTTNEAEFDSNATFPSNHVMRGTKVLEGHGMFEVFAVGDNTENGKVFEAAQIDNSIKTPLNEQLEGLSRMISKTSYILAATIIVGRMMVYFDWAPLVWILVVPTIIFFWLAVKKFSRWNKKKCMGITFAYAAILILCILGFHDYLRPDEDIALLLQHTLNTLMIAVTLIVMSVPEGLPMAVTLSLAYSMRRMLKANNLVRKMHACETMGAATIICTDKTGTLTQNRMTVGDTFFNSVVDGKPTDSEEGLMLKENIAVNSTASLDLSKEKPEVLGNPTEGALLLWMHKNGIDFDAMRHNVEILEELPFTTEIKYMAVVVKSGVMKGKKILYVKGAPEIVINMCDNICGNIDREEYKKRLAEYQSQAMRTLAFAYTIIEDNREVIKDGRVCASDLNFMGIVAISDPVRKEVPAAISDCMDAGIRVMIITGDTPGTAKEIGRQIGLWTDTDNEKNIITGPEVAALTEDELDKRIMDIKVVSRARPMDKKRLVESLQRKNQVVAVTGDGTNDAPALNTAHVGLSMGDGTSVAKEASDITIVDNSFRSIVNAVMWGRSLFLNIKRFLLFQLTVNVTACLTVLAGAFTGVQSPLTVTQILWVNLIMDTFAAVALVSLPPSKRVMKDKPRNRKDFIINKSMRQNILGVGGVFFVMLMVFLYIFEHADIKSLTDLLNLNLGDKDPLSPYELTLFFTIFVMTHFFYLFNTHAYMSGGSAFKLKGCRALVLIAFLIFISQICIVEIPGLQNFFNVCNMKYIDWLIIVIGSSFVLWIREIWNLVKPKQ